LALKAIGDPYALKRWQDHHSSVSVVVFFFLTYIVLINVLEKKINDV